MTEDLDGKAVMTAYFLFDKVRDSLLNVDYFSKSYDRDWGYIWGFTPSGRENTDAEINRRNLRLLETANLSHKNMLHYLEELTINLKTWGDYLKTLEVNDD